MSPVGGIQMRKKSHIILGKCLADHVDQIKYHKTAFCFGNLLPDLKPSFITVRHEYNVNFESVCASIRQLVEECGRFEFDSSYYWMQVGEVAHYVADYFTFPHNEHYTGTFMEHNYYEADLKNDLKAYILGGHAEQHFQKDVTFDSFEQIIEFIKKAHKIYEMKERCVEEDIKFIVTVCYQVVQGIAHLVEERLAEQLVPCFA